MGRRVKAALGLHRSNAVFNECRKNRAAFAASVQRKGKPIAVGDSVLTRSSTIAGVVRELRPDSSCTVEYTAEGVSTLIEYKHAGHPTKGVRSAAAPIGALTEEAAVAGTSGRAAGIRGIRQFAALRRPPVRLAPSARAEWKDNLSDADVAKIRAFFYDNGAVSPCTRDRVRRRVGLNLWQVAQALVTMQTMDALFSQFQTDNVLCGTALSYSSFKKLAPWNLRRIKRETCLYRTCELYKCNHDAMDTVPAIFSLPDATPAASPAAEAPAAAPASPAVEAPAAAPASPAADAPAASLGSSCSDYSSKVSRLLDFCRLESKRAQVISFCGCVC
ncbi:hypothetical protein T492DRAFT_926037 [Pavlovales sp. CCMP2436]|nr:hypothetical protein T492DRAFT_926037 [Pavlovales sp. CCMP2436]